jgi:hypothetical protein
MFVVIDIGLSDPLSGGPMLRKVCEYGQRRVSGPVAAAIVAAALISLGI